MVGVVPREIPGECELRRTVPHRSIEIVLRSMTRARDDAVDRWIDGTPFMSALHRERRVLRRPGADDENRRAIGASGLGHESLADCRQCADVDCLSERP